MSVQSDLEDEFGIQLLEAGIRFKRQIKLVPKRQFLSDFVLYIERDTTPALTVEVDGDVFASFNFYKGNSKKPFGGHDGKGKIRDCVKSGLLLAQGIHTFRCVKQTIQDGSAIAAVTQFLQQVSAARRPAPDQTTGALTQTVPPV